VSSDAHRILWAQALRALAYGFGSVLLGTSLAARGWSASRVGLLLTLALAGTVLASVAVGRWGDRLGRRRCYFALFLAMAMAGLALGVTDDFAVLAAVVLTGAISTDVVESGPFTSLEQPMLADDLEGRARTRAFGIYNAVAALTGSLGALAAGGPALLGDPVAGPSAQRRLFLGFVVVGALGAALAASLSARVEATGSRGSRATPLGSARRKILGLSSLFALDAFGGGFVVQSFIAFSFARRFGTSLGALGVLFFFVGLLQTASFLAATRLAERFGLLGTMVFTHLPSNVLLGAIAFAPSFGVAVALLLARQALSQMDVPVRQAYVMALVGPGERTAAAASTNAARYIGRPLGPVLAGAAQQIALGLPFLLAGSIKATYDVVLWRRFRDVPLAEAPAASLTALVPAPTDEVDG